MPITQSRMLALLDAAQDYQQALEMVCNTLWEQQEAVLAGRATEHQAWLVASASANAVVLLRNPIGSPRTIVAEALHFKANAKRNIKKAQKMAENRENDASGIPRPNRGPSTAPKSIIPTSSRRSLIEQAMERQAGDEPPPLASALPEHVSQESMEGAARFLQKREAESQFNKLMEQATAKSNTPAQKKAEKKKEESNVASSNAVELLKEEKIISPDEDLF